MCILKMFFEGVAFLLACAGLVGIVTLIYLLMH